MTTINIPNPIFFSFLSIKMSFWLEFQSLFFFFFFFIFSLDFQFSVRVVVNISIVIWHAHSYSRNTEFKVNLRYSTNRARTPEKLRVLLRSVICMICGGHVIVSPAFRVIWLSKRSHRAHVTILLQLSEICCPLDDFNDHYLPLSRCESRLTEDW